jgi:hypothetical protein
MLLAHFTPAELPGTLAVLLLGLSMGALIVTRHEATRTMLIVAVSLVVFGFLGYWGDVRAWPEALRIAIDLVFLAHAFVLFGLVLRRHRASVG